MGIVPSREGKRRMGGGGWRREGGMEGKRVREGGRTGGREEGRNKRGRRKGEGREGGKNKRREQIARELIIGRRKEGRIREEGGRDNQYSGLVLVGCHSHLVVFILK